MSVRVDITANAQAYEQALNRLGQLQDRFEQRLRGVGQTSQRVGREERELNRARAQVLQQIMTPQERYNQRIGELDRLLGRNKLSQEEYNRAVRNAKTEMDGAAQSGEDAFGENALSKIRSVAGALGLAGGLAGALQLVRRHWQDITEAQRESFQMSVQMAGAQEGAHMMLGLTTEAERSEFDQAVMGLAAGVGAAPSEVYRRAADVLSARGTMTWQEALPALEASFAVAPIHGQVGRRYAGAALDLRRAGMDPEAALGFVMQGGEMARVTEAAKIAETVPQVAAAGMAYGARPEFGAALWATMTHAATDLQGDVSRTAVINLLEKLDEFDFPDARPATAEDALARLQGDPALAEAFIEKGGFAGRAQAAVGMRDIIRGGEHAEAMAETLSALAAAGPQRAALFRESVEGRATAPAQQVAAVERALEGLKERVGTGRDLEEQFAAAIRKMSPGILQQAGVDLRGRAAVHADDWLQWAVPGTPGPLATWEAAIGGQREEFHPQRGRLRGREGAAESFEALTEFLGMIRDMRALLKEQRSTAESVGAAAAALNRGARGGRNLAPADPQADE